MTMSVNATQSSPPSYLHDDHGAAATPTEGTHDLMCNLLTAHAHQRDLPSNFNIQEMPEEITSLLNNPTGDLERGLMDYMNKLGINSITFINLDSNGYVDSIVTVTKRPDNRRDLNFEHSALSAGGSLKEPYYGNLHEASHMQEFSKIMSHGNYKVLDDSENENSPIQNKPEKIDLDTVDRDFGKTKMNFVASESEVAEIKTRKKVRFEIPQRDHKSQKTHNGNRSAGAQKTSTQRPEMPEKSAKNHTTYHFGDNIHTEMFNGNMNNVNGVVIGNITQENIFHPDGSFTSRQTIGSVSEEFSTKTSNDFKTNPQSTHAPSTARMPETSTSNEPRENNNNQGSVHIKLGKGTIGGDFKFDKNSKVKIDMNDGLRIEGDGNKGYKVSGASKEATIIIGDTFENFNGLDN